jgi:hypothetical protein
MHTCMMHTYLTSQHKSEFTKLMRSWRTIYTKSLLWTTAEHWRCWVYMRAYMYVWSEGMVYYVCKSTHDTLTPFHGCMAPATVATQKFTVIFNKSVLYKPAVQRWHSAGQHASAKRRALLDLNDCNLSQVLMDTWWWAVTGRYLRHFVTDHDQ